MPSISFIPFVPFYPEFGTVVSTTTGFRRVQRPDIPYSETTGSTYRNCTVNPGGTIVFSAGSYIFSSLVVGNDATAKFNVAMDQTIDINVQSTLEFRDRATAEFVGKGYAPCVRIYTNASSFNLSCDTKLTGIFIAPHAAVTVFSRSNLHGALYAKSINVEPDAVIASNFVNPNGDEDGDCIPNLIEMLLLNDPGDGTKYSIVSVPDAALIDNSVEKTVSYDYCCRFDQYPNSCDVPVTYPAGSLTNQSIAPVFMALNAPPITSSIPAFNKTGYVPVGCYFTMLLNTIKTGSSVEIGLPMPITAMPSSVERKVAWFDSDPSVNDWVIASGRGDHNAIYGMVDEATAMIIVEPEAVNSMAAYLDAGDIYSSSGALSAVEARITLSGAVSSGSSPAGTVTITFKNAAGVTQPTVTFNLYERGGFLALPDRNRFEFKENITVTNVSITSSANSLSFSLPCNHIVRLGQTVTFFADKTLAEFTSPDVIGEKCTAQYNANTLAFESLSFSEGVVKKNTPTDPNVDATWFYHYYLRDHLGSTRMVVSNTGSVVTAVMYQPYGMMTELVSGGTEKTREQFTGKEQDKEGYVSGLAAGMSLYYFGARYYDSDIGGWVSCDKAGQFFNPYGYGTNPVIMVDEDGNFIFVPMIFIGLWLGAYQGGKIGIAQHASGLEMLGYIFAGALIGGGSAALGGIVSEASIGLSSTAGMITSSTANSLGYYALSGGQTDITTNFGFGGINWSKGEYNTNKFWKEKGARAVLDFGGWWGNAGDVYGMLKPIGSKLMEYSLNEMSEHQRFLYKLQKDFKDFNKKPLYGNYLGPDSRFPDDCSGIPFPVDKLDTKAMAHDLAYIAEGSLSSGVEKAFFNANLLVADAKLSVGMALSLFTRMNNWKTGYLWAAGGSVLFSGFATAKSLQEANISGYNYYY